MKKILFLHIILLFFTGSALNGQFAIDSIVPTPVSCGGFSDGNFTVHISNGSGLGFIYRLMKGPTILDNISYDPIHTFSIGQEKGVNYIIAVFDSIDLGNPQYVFNNEIGGPDVIDISSSTSYTTDMTCATGDDGTIYIDASGEAGYLKYELSGDGSGISYDGNFGGLGIGTYNVTVTDSTEDCPSSDIELGLTISSPPDLTFTSIDITDVLCFGDATGSIEITVTGGTPFASLPDYEYTWVGAGISSPNDEDQYDLIQGNDYEVTVKDGNGCELSSGILVVDEAAEIEMTILSTTDINCFGDTTGTVDISLTGGVNPIDFVWTGINTGHVSTKRNADDLIADEYKVEISDKDNCSKIYNPALEIFQPNPISVNVDNSTDVACFNEATGSIEITISGGSGSFPTTIWTGPTPSTIENPVNLLSGAYSLDVVDSKGCSENFSPLVTIDQPDDITAVMLDSTDALCYGSSTGTAQVLVENGTPGYTYLWTGNLGHTTSMANPDTLKAETYELEVTDDNGCVKPFPNIVSIGQPDDITNTITVTDVDCNGDASGAIDIEPDNGTAPYTFSWTGTGVIPDNEDQTGITAGFYNVTVTDANGCFKIYNNIEVKENAFLDASFAITPLTCYLSADGEIEATLSGGVRPHTYSWESDPAGFTNTTDSVITGLNAVDYVLTLTDFLGCSEEFLPQTVTQPDSLFATFNPTDISCYDSINGSIDIDISGGTGPFLTTWSDPAFLSSDEDISGLAQGTYSLYLEDDNGCFENYPNEITINEPTEITISETHNDIACAGENNGSISVVASDGSPGYTFLWAGPGGFNETTADINNLVAGQYDLTVTDLNGCPKDFSDVATIIQPDSIKVTIHSQSTLDCFGDSDGSVDITTSGGTGVLSCVWKDSGGGVVSTDTDASGLSAGTYTLEITDTSLCVAIFTDTITFAEPDEVIISLSKTDVKCNGDSDGTVTVTTTGGTAPYQYRILGGGPYDTDMVFTGLGAATHTLYTIDSESCEATDIITVSQPSQISYSDFGVLGDNICNGDTDDTIYINTVSGGVPPYQYSIDNGLNYQDSNIFPNLGGGSYPVKIIDFNLCEVVVGDFNVYEPDSIKITFYDQDDVSTCHDNPEGSITLIAAGGTGNLQYSNKGGAELQPTGVFNNLMGGTYDIQIIDDSLCTRDTIVEITRPIKLEFNKADTIPVTGCGGDSNGGLDAEAIGGTLPIQYSLDDISYQVSGIFGGLWASDTTAYAKDAKGCIADTTVTITEPEPITFISENTVPVDCNGASTGSVIVVASGGTAPYNYTLYPPVGLPVSQATGTFTGLPAGSYTVDVQDTPLCGPILSSTLNVGEPAPIIVDSVKTDFISCNNASDAEIHIFVSGGSPPYEYSYDGGGLFESSSAKTGLNGGTYNVLVKDINGCTEPVGTYNFVNPAAVSLTASLTPVSPCFEDTNGAISALASGGWDSFEYSINGADYQASGDFSGLSAGDYTIFTIDTGNCSSTMNISITEPDEVTATITKTDYVDAVLGTITISSASGGVSPYDYSIYGFDSLFSSTTAYIDLIAGSYDVVVKDDSACTHEETILIYDIIPLTMIIDSSDVSCFGEDDGFIEFLPQDAFGEVLYSIDNSPPGLTTPRFENLQGDSMYILRAIDEDGKVFWDSVYINEPPQLIVNSIPTQANCYGYSATGEVDITASGGTGGYTYNWSNGAITEDISNLVAGSYSVIVTDNSGCFVFEDIIITSKTPPLNADAGKDTSICYGETIILEGVAQANDVVLWEPSTYLSNSGIFNPVAVNVIDSITYTFRVTETSSPYGCYDIDTISILVFPNVGIEVTQDTVALQGQEIQLEATGGPFESYNWIPITGLSANDIMDPIATGQNSILYYVNGTNEYGCIETDSVYIEIIENITVYNAFSPNNGDDINQYFVIENASGFPQMLVEIYNRWGSRVFSSVGYSDDKRWDGTARGKDVPIGTYYYIIIPYPDATPVTGNVTIIR